MTLTLDSKSGILQFSCATCQITNWRMSLEADGNLLTSDQSHVELLRDNPLAFRLSFPEAELVWTFTCREPRETGRVIIESVIENKSDHGIRLGKAFLLDTSEDVKIGNSIDDVLCLDLKGSIVGRVVHRINHPESPRESKIKLQLYNQRDRLAMQVGFITFRRANTEIFFDHATGPGDTTMRASCDFAGWVLGPGESSPTETFSLAVGVDPFAQLESWADLAAERCSPRQWGDVPIGWVGFSWVDPMFVERYEDVIFRNAEAIRRRLDGFGVSYIWESIGNLPALCPGDWLSWNYELFPSGPEFLGSKLKEMGFTLGFWCGIFYVCALLDNKVGEYREFLLKNEDGSLMVVGESWPFTSSELYKNGPSQLYCLDPSHPRSVELWKTVFETYRKWGVRYYMLDFLDAGTGNIGSFPYKDHFDKRLVAGPEAFHNALQAARDAAGEDTYFLSSTGPSVHCAGSVHAVRTGTDFGEGRMACPNFVGQYPGTFTINKVDFWNGALSALRDQASNYYTHRKLYINDSGNVLTVDKPLKLTDAHINATIHAMSGGPTMLGDDIDRIDDERLSLIKKTLPRSRDVAFPVDLFDSAYPDYPKVFHRKVEKPWGRFDVVAVYNFGEDMLRLPVQLSKLGLKPDAAYLVWEFWNAEYAGRIEGALQAVVPPGSVRVYRLTEDISRPVLLGTDMHLLMGEMEVERCDWDSDTRTLDLLVNRPQGEHGSVFLHVPCFGTNSVSRSIRPVDQRELWVARDGRDQSLIIRVAFSFEDGPAGRSIEFVSI
ncbi:MAG: hypothetical protein Q7T82_17000 [Armatimonadota bacterium]|nr:hypothetical protein [Armatimonadota bacterium]